MNDYYEELCQQSYQEADGITQYTIDERTRENAEEEIVPQCLNGNDQELTQNHRHDATVNVDDEKIQGDVGEDIDDDRGAQNYPILFAQKQQDYEFYQNRRNEGKQQRWEYHHRLNDS